MAKELNEDTTLKRSVKTIIALGFGIATIIAGWTAWMAEIQLDKEEQIQVDVKWKPKQKVDCVTTTIKSRKKHVIIYNKTSV